MTEQYKYKKLLNKKIITFSLGNTSLKISKNSTSSNEVLYDDIDKVLLDFGQRPHCIIYSKSSSYSLTSASFDDNGKPTTNTKSYYIFLTKLVEKLPSTVLFQQSTWTHFFLLLVSMVIIFLVSLFWFYLAYQTYAEIGYTRKFMFHLVYGLVAFILAVLGLKGLKRPIIMNNNSVLELIRSNHRD